MAFKSLIALFSFVVFFSTAQAANEQNSSVCKKLESEVAKSFVKEFDLDAKQAKRVSISYLHKGEVEVVNTTHPELCGFSGCDSALYVVSKTNCDAKPALLFRGALKPLGPKTFPYQKISVVTRKQAVDGGGTTAATYSYDDKTHSYEQAK